MARRKSFQDIGFGDDGPEVDVLVMVRGGVVQDVRTRGGEVVRIIDYDTDGCDCEEGKDYHVADFGW